MVSNLMYNSIFNMGDMILRRVLIISCEIFLRTHLRDTSRISLLGSGMSRVGDLGDAIFKLL